MFLSMIIPLYNGEKYIEECLESCLAQNILDYEIVCVNDGSTDRSKAIVEKYEKIYSNVKVINQENEGVSIARNNGLKFSKGEYIWFIDADDIVKENILKKIKNIVDQKKRNVDRIKVQSYCFNDVLNHSEKLLIKNNTIKSNYPYKDTQITRTILRKEYVEKNQIFFSNKMKLGEDTIYNYKTRIYDHFDTELDEVAYFYRKHSESTTACQSEKKIKNYIDSANEALDIVIKDYNSRVNCAESKKMITYWIKILMTQYLLLPINTLGDKQSWYETINFRFIDVYFRGKCVFGAFILNEKNYKLLKIWNAYNNNKAKFNSKIRQNVKVTKGILMHPKRIVKVIKRLVK